MNPLGQMLTLAYRGVLEGINRSLVQDLWSEFASILFHPIPILTDPLIVRLQQVGVSVALGALPFVIAYHAVRRMADAGMGASTVPAETLFRRSVIATLTVTGISLFAFFASTLMEHTIDLIRSIPSTVSVVNMLFDMDSTSGTLTNTFFFLVFLGAIGCLIIQRYIFAAEFGLLLIVGAFIGLTRVGTDEALPWDIWKRELRAILLTTVIQLLILFLFAERLAGMDDALRKSFLTTISRWFQSGALVYLLWNTPRWARQFTYSTGTSHAVGGLAVQAGRMAMIRHMVTLAAKGGS